MTTNEVRGGAGKKDKNMTHKSGGGIFQLVILLSTNHGRFAVSRLIGTRYTGSAYLVCRSATGEGVVYKRYQVVNSATPV